MTLYRVIISPEAQRLMGNCVLFLAEKSFEAAVMLKERLVEEVRELERFPQRYPFFNEPYLPANKYHKMFVERYYLVLYQIKDDAVFVEYVVDCRQDFAWLLR